MPNRPSYIPLIFRNFPFLLMTALLFASCNQVAQPNTAQRCESGNFCWVSPGVPGYNLNAIWGTRSNDIWAAGDKGTVLHYDGNTWASVSLATPTEINIRAIWGSSATDVWFAGDLGKILHYSEADHLLNLAHLDPANPVLGAVHGSSPTDIWFVGEKHTILHYDGQNWNNIAVDAKYQNFSFTSVWADSPTDVWIAYSTLIGMTPSTGILHYDGQTLSSSFVRDSNDVHGPITNIWRTAPDRLWAGGGDLYLAYSSDSNAWSILEKNLSDFISIADFQGDRLWGIFQGSAGYYSRTEKTMWTLQTDRLGRVVLKAIWGSKDSNLWAVGENGAILHILDREVDIGASIIPQIEWNDIWGTDGNQLWAVGRTSNSPSQGAIWHYDGTKWAPQAVPPSINNLNRIWGSDAQHIWAVGTGNFPGVILFYDGTQWLPETRLAPKLQMDSSLLNLSSLGGSDGSHVFAGRDDGNTTGVLLQFNGTKWSQMSDKPFSDIWVADANHLWATSSTEINVLVNGTPMSVKIPTGLNLRDLHISGSDPSHAWVVGRAPGAGPNYILLSCDTTMCTQPPLNNNWPAAKITRPVDTRLWVRSNNDIFVKTGDEITHWNGTAWSVIVSGPTFNGFWSNAAGSDQWLAGAGSAILHHAPTAP